MVDRAQLQLEQRRARDRSLALVITGVVLLLPPIAGVALVDVRIAGIPMPLIYVFVVWIGLIIGAARLASRLHSVSETQTRDDGVGANHD